ncbi:hypothetical protein ES332_A07G097100v1 [Gossypium tomentosum]|uniref:ENTH domain-containing protein n=1 Tax=Gossypium tomentosum TaxID=34277 RepID=A0A5D2PRL0_GOSTO|nr:hypothetical protein ES332_A07G097100v1 [Gossypium tomentosum]
MPSRLKRAIGAVKDQTSISLAKIVNTNSSNLDVAVLKATTRDLEPVNERYVNDILVMISSNKLHAAICANAIAKRIGKTKNWVVALKSLMIVLRIFQNSDPFFPQEVLHARNRGAKILNLTTFNDYSQSSPYDYTAFVRSFAFYLDQRLDCLVTENIQQRVANKTTGNGRKGSRRINPQHVREMNPPMLLDRISYWQRLLDRAIATKPTGAAKNNRLVQVSVLAVVRESFDLYRDISDGLGLLLDSFFHLQHQSCINAFQYCVKAAQQFEELALFYDYCKDLGIGKIYEYPSVQKISEELMDTLREFLKDQASFPSYKSPRSTDDTKESQRSSKCTSLEDLMYQTDCDEAISTSFLPGHYSKVDEEQCLEKEDMYNVHETGSNHSLPIDHETSVTIDFVSFDDWLTGDNKLEELRTSSKAKSTNGGDFWFDNRVQQDHKQEQWSKNGANGLSPFGKWIEEDHGKDGAEADSFVDNWIQGTQQLEQVVRGIGEGHSYFDELHASRFVGNGHSLLIADDWLRENKKEPEEQQPNSSNDGYMTGWELVLAEATPQPAQGSQHLACGIKSDMAIDLFDHKQIVLQRTYNPFLEDETDVATAATIATMAFPDKFLMAPPIFFANEMARPTFQAMPTTLFDDPNVYDPFAPWPNMKVNNNDCFNGEDEQQNLIHQQELWLQNQNKIIARHIVSSNIE